MLFLGETFEKTDKVTITNVFWGAMRIEKVRVEGYRLLEDIEIVLEKNSTVIVGRNNSGKTSFTSIFDCFCGESGARFRLEDFSSLSREKFLNARKLKEEGQVQSRYIIHCL